MSLYRVFILVVCVAALQVQAQHVTLHGRVTDASTGEPLVAANIRLQGTTRGTITNADGEYRLSLPVDTHTIIFSFVGYRPDTVAFALSRDTRRDVVLTPTAIQFAEVVVTDEDPAYRIMRKVIERKSRWAEALRSYECRAFTRQVISLDTSIATITESYSIGYWQRGDTLREIVTQRRQTANVPPAANFAAVGGIQNFYDDEIRLGGFRFVGPTAPDAFDYYAFKLLQTRESDGVIVHVIEMIPKSRLTPLFRGTISVDGESYAVMGVEVSPNEAFTLPFVDAFSFTYAQQFSLYDRLFWMPVDIRLRGWVEVNLPGLTFPRVGFEQVSSIYEYFINPHLADSIFRKPRRIVMPEADRIDSAFWAQHEVLPLTAEQQRAYVTLDSTQTLDRQLRPGGSLAVFSEITSSSLKYVDLRFNRVEGFYFGGKGTFDRTFRSTSVSAHLGYGVRDRRGKWQLQIEFPLDSLKSFSVGANAFRRIAHLPDEGFVDPLTITLSSLLEKNDPRDYYYADGVSIYTRARLRRNFEVRLSFQQEQHRSAAKQTDFSLLFPSLSYRPNPSIDEGRLRSLSLSGRLGGSPVPVAIFAQDFLEFELEGSSQSVMKSDFSFWRGVVRGEVSTRTYARRLFLSPTLYIRLTAGGSSGDLPAQRLFSLESRYSGFGPFGVLRGVRPRQYVGEQFLMLNVEHNFRTTPFLALNLPYLYRKNIELMLHGSVARCWMRRTGAQEFGTDTDGWYAEAGFGIARILGFFRVDVTRRLSHRPATFLSFAFSRVL